MIASPGLKQGIAEEQIADVAIGLEGVLALNLLTYFASASLFRFN